MQFGTLQSMRQKKNKKHCRINQFALSYNIYPGKDVFAKKSLLIILVIDEPTHTNVASAHLSFFLTLKK